MAASTAWLPVRQWLVAIAASAAVSGGVLAGEDWCVYLWRHR